MNIHPLLSTALYYKKGFKKDLKWRVVIKEKKRRVSEAQEEEILPSTLLFALSDLSHNSCTDVRPDTGPHFLSGRVDRPSEVTPHMFVW